jgi:peptidoglycan hydrolase-like protein with peptidoglycan-binding domain
MAVGGAVVLLVAGIWTALATTSAGAIPRSGRAGPEKVRFPGTYSTTRLDELLAQLGYLPLTWAPSAGQTVPAANDAAGQLAAARNAPRGQFTWKSGYPSELRRFWRDGTTRGLILQGAVMAFEQQHGLKADGIAGSKVWDALLTAVADHDVNNNGYTYAIASEGDPETLTIWHNGRQVLQTDANTGIPASPTTIGTSPVYLKYHYQDMKGTNPNGTPYSSPVYYVSYFRGNLAVHWYPRTSYGFPQSLGCVELPWSAAKTAWQYLSYGSLVTVQPGSQTPSTSPVDPTT